jgi:hypothetical protein
MPLGHQDLSRIKMLHRDISVNNIMIDLSSGLRGGQDARGGILIDLDMAKDLQENLQTYSRPQRTVSRISSALINPLTLDLGLAGYTTVYVIDAATLSHAL